jgi:endonuclease V-like protein UPF0215 family
MQIKYPHASSRATAVLDPADLFRVTTHAGRNHRTVEVRVVTATSSPHAAFSGEGVYVKADGTPGKQAAKVYSLTRDTVPEPVRAALLAARIEAMREALAKTEAMTP